MLPTLAEVLDLAAVQAGAPRVVAAPDGLDRPVRWVHAIELADAARLLHGGELVLSTGIALPDDPGPQARYVAELAGVGVAGLAVELGRKYAGRLPAGLVTAAQDRGLPLIAFEREVRFVEITEAVHARIIDSQLTELRAATQVHEVFTGLSVAGASPAEIIEAATRLAGRPVILADLTHSVLASAGLASTRTVNPGAAGPGAAGPRPTNPGTAGPGTARTGPARPGAVGSEPASPETVEPGAARTGPARPGAVGSESASPETVESGAARTGPAGREAAGSRPASAGTAGPGPAGSGWVTPGLADFAGRSRQALARAVPAGPLLAGPRRGRTGPVGSGQPGTGQPGTGQPGASLAGAEVLSDDGRAVEASPAGAVTGSGLTVFDPETGWLITPVGAHGEVWGRVTLAAGRPPEPLDVMLAERAATALALGRLQARQRESLERQAHRTLIAAIVSPSGPAGTEQAATRARALGLPTEGRQLIALVARLPAAGPGLSAQAQVLAVADAMAAACRAEQVPAIVGSLDDLRAGALLSLAAGTDPDAALTAVSHRVRPAAPAGPYPAARPNPAAGPNPAPGSYLAAGPNPAAGAYPAAGPYPAPGRYPAAGADTRAGPPDLVLAAGSAASSVQDAARSFAEARQVADAAVGPDAVAGIGGRSGRPFLRLADLRLAGLLQLLRGDPRVQAFAEREVGPLLAYDAQHGTTLTAVLGAYLDAGGNKALTAQRTHLARPTLYERLSHIERLLGVSLDSPRSRASLHVALLAQGTSTATRP